MLAEQYELAKIGTESAVESTVESMATVRLDNGEDTVTSSMIHGGQTKTNTEPEAIPVAEAANYNGSWFNIQYERMQSPDFRDKFRRFLETHISSMKTGIAQSPLDKPEHFQLHYREQLDELDDNLNIVYSSVVYGLTKDVGGKSPGGLGHGKIGRPGTLYSNATNHDGAALSDRHKDIIAGHEAYHGIVDAQGSASQEVKSGFDWDMYDELIDTTSVKQPNYLRNPDELMARMAQFKNYFGMKSSEIFQAEHLRHLRAHYVRDTGLDNGISLMLNIITSKTEPNFIRIMNQLPL